jgi:hypothetical protein
MDKFPSWRYGPNGQSGVFESEADVPKGWQDHPSKVSASAPAGNSPAKAASTKKADNKPADKSPAKGPELDADGHPYDAALHAGTGSKTKAGLWRMKVGIARPDPAPGYPLDL